VKIWKKWKKKWVNKKEKKQNVKSMIIKKKKKKKKKKEQSRLVTYVSVFQMREANIKCFNFLVDAINFVKTV